jgi:hypothetical protein
MRSPAAITVALALSSLLIACGGDDDGGDADGDAVDGAPLAELTAEDLLEMLLDVDGDGSGLDADTIDGLDSDELARRSRRSVFLQPSSLTIDGSDEPALANVGDARAAFFLRVPPDAAPGEPLDLYIGGIVVSGTPCGLALAASVVVFVGDGDIVAGTIEDGDIVTVSNDDYFTIHATIPESELITPGTFIFPAIYRNGIDASDTCTEPFGIIGVSVEYDGV